MTDSIGDKLLELRRKKLMSLTQVAELSGLSPSTIAKVEKGKTPWPREKTLAAISKAYEMSPEQLSNYLGYAGQRKEEKKDKADA